MSNTSSSPKPLLLTADRVAQIMPKCPREKLVGYFPFLVKAMQEFEINTPLRAAAFLAQIAHESNELRNMEEEDSGERYEGRKDLGNVEAGDGARFKGRGPLQLTGRTNYHVYGRSLGLDLEDHPEQAEEPGVEFRVAGLYWKWHHLNVLADAKDFDGITRAINGGLNGKAQRDAYYSVALKVLG